MTSIRREVIREYIEHNNIVTLAQLTGLLPDVTLMTIHRDLSFLQEQGLVEKIRGGARYITHEAREPAFSAREIINKEAKQIIAEKVVPLLDGAGSIFVDAGTTMMSLAKAFPDIKLVVTTTGPNIALELAKRRELVVNLCGGTLNKSNLTLSGTAAMDTLSGINIDIAFLVPTGYSPEAGFTCGMETEAAIKKLVIAKARTVVMLMDSSKLKRLLPYTFGQIGDLDCLVTEKNPVDLPEYIQSKAPNLTIL